MVGTRKSKWSTKVEEETVGEPGIAGLRYCSHDTRTPLGTKWAGRVVHPRKIEGVGIKVDSRGRYSRVPRMKSLAGDGRPREGGATNPRGNSSDVE